MVSRTRRWCVVGLAGLVVGLAGAASAATTRARPRPPIPNPIAAARYLAEQRAGFGSPAQAASLSARAFARAQQIRARAIPSVPGPPSFTHAWSPLGPMPVTQSFYGGADSGRVDSAAVVQTGPNAGEIFVGTAGGGVWSSSDNGASWVTHTDQAATGLAVGAVTIDPVDPSIVYAGTGEANDCGDCFYGGGVLKSTDGGATWTVENPGGIFSGVDFASIAVDPNDDRRIYATTTAGFYVSTDSGASWAHPSGTGTFGSSTWGLALDPTTSPTTVYIATASHGIQKSTDGGVNFTTLGGGLPSASVIGITELGIGTKTSTFPNGDKTLYASVQLQSGTDDNGGDLSMYRTTDSGSSWSRLTIPAYTNQSYSYGGPYDADQADYDNTLAVDPADPSHVIAGGISAVETTDGGSTWANLNGGCFFGIYYGCGPSTAVLHPDFHAVAFAPSGKAILGCDGGVFEYDPSVGVEFGVSNLNTNLSTAQVYEDLGVYDDGTQILAGLQDNGADLYSGSASWPQALSGDGGYGAINPLDPVQQFGEADEGLYETTDAWTLTANLITPPGEPDARTNFVPPMTIVPNSSSHADPTVYFGGGDLWVTRNVGSTWTQITDVGSGVSAIAVAPSNPDVLYVGFDDGTLLVSDDATSGSPTFTDISPTAGDWITHIDVDPGDPGSIALSFTAGGFNTQSFPVPPMVETGAVTLTGTPSASYTDITGNLPDGVASNSVVFDDGTLVAATDVGVFFTRSPNGGSTTWSAVGTGLPNVQVIALSVDGSGSLYAGTHGRGVWKLVVPMTVPTVTDVSPSSGSTAGGTSVTITGTDFTGATAVSFGASPAASFAVNGSTAISAVSPAEAAGTVDVTVTTGSGTTATSASDRFTFVAAAAPPTITAVSPTQAAVGSTIAVTGTNFGGATSVRLNGRSAAYTVVSSSRLTFTVPQGATSGTITVTTAAGAATSTQSVTVSPPPTITGFTPGLGPVGTTVTVMGTNLEDAIGVELGSILTVPSTVAGDGSQITFTIPPGAVSGPIKVLTGSGTVTSAGSLTVTG
jgi:hypothetical protein